MRAVTHMCRQSIEPLFVALSQPVRPNRRNRRSGSAASNEGLARLLKPFFGDVFVSENISREQFEASELCIRSRRQVAFRRPSREI
jgi:hypothetical protein